ncbi:hypothetical protein Tco_0431767 [Tanacetum coccineum]
MVAYLKKPTGSEGFQEIVDFLNGSHIRFALTKNPTIYVSIIEIFWQTATVRTIDNGEQEITATVDGKEFTIIEASQIQEIAGYEATVRLQEQLDEDERHRIARVHEEASSFNIEEWEDI